MDFGDYSKKIPKQEHLVHVNKRKKEDQKKSPYNHTRNGVSNGIITSLQRLFDFSSVKENTVGGSLDEYKKKDSLSLFTQDLFTIHLPLCIYYYSLFIYIDRLLITNSRMITFIQYNFVVDERFSRLSMGSWLVIFTVFVSQYPRII